MVTLTKKEKLLASAQKSLQKGQISKAIKDYQQLVELDPKDLRTRQKLAELYNRANMPALAIEEFQKVGKHYTDNGFYLKAIAVFKQIQRIDPAECEVYLKLAELNEKQGLIGNALAEYRSLVAHYEKLGDTAGMIKVLHKMKNIDPENLNIRVKLAETFAKNGKQEEAMEDFQEVLKVLLAKKDNAKILKLYEIFVGFFPEEPTLKLGLGQALVLAGNVEKGVAQLESLLEADPSSPDILRSLAEGYRKKGDHNQEAVLYSRLLNSFPGDLDLCELLVQACLDGDKPDQALQLLEEKKSAFFEGNRIAKLTEFYESLQGRLPGEERVVATLHSIYEVSGDGAKLFDILSSDQTGKSAFGPKGKSSFEAPSEAEDVDSAENLFESEEEDEPLLDTSVVEEAEEIPLEFLQGVEGEDSFTDTEKSAEENEFILELDLDDAFGGLDFDEPKNAATAVPDEPKTVELDADELSFSFDDDEDVAEGLTAGLDVEAQVETPAADVTAQLEEAGFYLIQGLFDDAERVCMNLLDCRPGYQAAEELLADIRSQRQQGSAPQAAASQDDFFDFSAEMMAEMEEAVDLPAPADVKKNRHAPDSDFTKFKKRVEEQIDAEDEETHFNLGIAYREMGLIDDAIGEFDHAMKDPTRRLDCLTLKGICLLDKKDFKGAEASFKLGLSTPDLATNQKLSLFYELGLLYEAWDRPLDALDSFQSAADVDLFFRNVREKIQELRNRLGMEDGDDDSNPGGGGKDRVSYV